MGEHDDRTITGVGPAGRGPFGLHEPSPIKQAAAKAAADVRGLAEKNFERKVEELAARMGDASYRVGGSSIPWEQWPESSRLEQKRVVRKMLFELDAAGYQVTPRGDL